MSKRAIIRKSQRVTLCWGPRRAVTVRLPRTWLPPDSADCMTELAPNAGGLHAVEVPDVAPAVLEVIQNEIREAIFWAKTTWLQVVGNTAYLTFVSKPWYFDRGAAALGRAIRAARRGGSTIHVVSPTWIRHGDRERLIVTLAGATPVTISTDDTMTIWDSYDHAPPDAASPVSLGRRQTP